MTASPGPAPAGGEAARVTIGPYEILRPIGQGGFAKIFLARHTLLDELASLKIGVYAEDDTLLLREGKILWGLHHPSLPTLRDALRTPDGRLALAIRYVDGKTLESCRPLPWAAALPLLGRLLQALRVLHHRGIVHADVKPRNVVVEPDGHGAVLVDFGVAAVRPTAATRPIGHTEAFAAPEMLAGGPPVPESDLYGLGLSFIHALGGDVANRVLPSGAPEPLLELLTALSARKLDARPRWGSARDPLERFEEVRRKLGV